MMMVNHAFRLAAMGFWVFRLKPRAKTPLYKDWQAEATMDAEKIKQMWKEDPHANIGIYTGRFGQFMALVAVDVDNKDGRNGAATMCELEFDGKDFPTTYVQTTPTGGQHHVYFAKRSVNQGNANVLGHGLDLRSRGGYIVGSGSFVNGQSYTDNGGNIVQCPDWLFDLRDQPEAPKVDTQQNVSKINPEAATARAMQYLEAYAPTAEDGERNSIAYKVAARIKDFGVLEDECQSLMADWNGALDNPLEDDELERTVRSAYKTGANAIGALAAEAVFQHHEVMDAPEPRQKAPQEEEVKEYKHPVDHYNDNHSIVKAGGGHHILVETTDYKGNYKLDHIQEHSFHRMNAHNIVATAEGKGEEAATEVWMRQKDTRRYEGLVFAPNQIVDKRYFNMWRGFKYQPRKPENATPRSRAAVARFIEHAFENVCGSDETQLKYLMGYFAHIVQFPQIKPLVALVFKGEKGVGKNALVGCVAELLGCHALLTAKKRYLTSNFNGHLEMLLMLTLDEAFWSGDKDAEGGLKDLITGKTHIIERKGQEPYEVDNLCRVIILGNEAWLVPATHDERRYFVATVNNNRKQDTHYFEEMRLGMEAGGYEVLLDYLMSYDLSSFDVNKPPVTMGLTEQKVKTLDIMGQWWYDSLRFGKLAGAYNDLSFVSMEEPAMRSAFYNYCRNRNIRTRLPDNITFYEDLNQYAKSLVRVEDATGASYKCAGGLEQLRKDFDNYIKGEIKWQAISNTPTADVMD